MRRIHHEFTRKNFNFFSDNKKKSSWKGDYGMPTTMESFSQRARLVLHQAQQEAQNQHSATINVDHVFVALALVEGGISQHVWKNLGVSVGMLRSVYPAPAAPTTTRIELAPATLKLLEYSVAEARNFGHNYIGTEHLLLGGLRLQPTKIIEMLALYQITPENVVQMVMQVLENSST